MNIGDFVIEVTCVKITGPDYDFRNFGEVKTKYLGYTTGMGNLDGEFEITEKDYNTWLKWSKV